MKSLSGRVAAWCLAAVLACVTYVFAISLSSVIESQDPTLYARILFNRATGSTLGIVVLTGGLWLADYILPGKWLEKIGEDPMACMGISGITMYCLTWLLTSN